MTTDDLMKIISLPFFHALPLRHQVGLLVSVALVVFYIIYLANFRFAKGFEIINNANEQPVMQEIKIPFKGKSSKMESAILTKNGAFVGSYPVDEYIISKELRPANTFKLVGPETFEVNKYTEGGLVSVYVNLLKPYENLDDVETTGIRSAATTIRQTKPDEITLYTVVELMKKGVASPVGQLNIGNFSITEQYNNVKKEAEIKSLKLLQNSSLNMIFVVDVSGSMGSHISEVRVGILNMLNMISDSRSRDGVEGSFAILLASGDSRKDLRFLGNEGKVWFPFSHDKRDFKNIVSQIASSGNTPLYAAIVEANERLALKDKGAYNVIVCFSDGLENTSGVSSSDVIKALSSAQVPLYSVIYSSGSSSSDEVQLRQAFSKITESSGSGGQGSGWFMYNSSKNLVPLFVGIADRLKKSYELKWTSTGAESGAHVDVDINITYQTAREKPFSYSLKKNYFVQNLVEQPVK